MSDTRKREPAQQSLGPKGLPLVGNLSQLGKDPLGFLTTLHHNYGDIAFFSLGIGGKAVLVSNPKDVERVLLETGKRYYKGEKTFATDHVFGNGLVMSEGDLWRRQRKLAAPALQHSAIGSYATLMTDLTDQMLQTWKADETRDAHEDMMLLTQKIVVSSLFGGDAQMAGTRNITTALDDLLTGLGKEMTGIEQFLPGSIPTPSRRKLQKAVKQVDDIVLAIIHKRQEAPQQQNDLLGMLMEARDEQGEGMDAQQMLDEIRTIYIAGHETTATTLSWTWYALHHNPPIRERLEQELARVLDGRIPTVEESKKLPYTQAIIQESLRLFPPAWTFVRAPLEDVELGGQPIAKGTSVWISPWVIHHDARWYAQPDVYDPERWIDGLEKRLPKYAFCPFGGGPRICIGNHFALMEGTLLLATIAQRYRLELQDPNIELFPSATLRPKDGLAVRVQAREM